MDKFKLKKLIKQSHLEAFEDALEPHGGFSGVAKIGKAMTSKGVLIKAAIEAGWYENGTVAEDVGEAEGKDITHAASEVMDIYNDAVRPKKKSSSK